MTRISDLLAAGRTTSFEFFPPKTPQGVENLHSAVDELEAVEPSFVSVTYGAGGGVRHFTRDVVVGINRDRSFPAMPHLTCIGHTRAELVDLLDQYREAGVENILALAGDPPADGSPATGDFRYASELIELVRSRGEFSIGVAAFPEVHPRSADRDDDRHHLAAKLEAADFGITQFFFDADHYLAMVDELDSLGCTKPVLPGIIPLLDTTTIRRFATMNGAAFPEELGARIDVARDDAERMSIAVDAAVELAQRLADAGAPGLHIYALNRSEAALRILGALSK